MTARPIVLIGLPGAGKTTVAPLAARILNASWCDLDERVAADASLSVPEIFAQHGEAHFRELEHRAMRRALDEAPQVIAAGAGWAAEGGNLADVGPLALIIYMSLAPEIAAVRLTGKDDRPLLAGEAPERRIAELLELRNRWYRLADLEIDVGASPPEAVASGIVTAARQYGGW